ncbi:tRNA (adenosine(37)-N6)-dimethylallyltransferase MiaA [Desulfobacterota bacterium M19]
MQTSDDLFNNPLIFLVGPTAVGKTELAILLARELNGEIIGVDSMQIYKYMDIGTAKPTLPERAAVPHHLVDFIPPDHSYNAADFAGDCRSAIKEIRGRGRVPVLTGGTGLYFKALTEGIFNLPEINPLVREELSRELNLGNGRQRLFDELEHHDPESARRIHINDTYRLLRALEILRATGQSWTSFIHQQQAERKKSGEGRILKIGLYRERQELYKRINQRVNIMAEAGLLDEVKSLLARGYDPGLKSMQSLGYRHMINFLNKTWSWDATLELLARDTRRYAKRQFTWFKRGGFTWFQPCRQKEVIDTARNYMAQNWKYEKC